MEDPGGKPVWPAQLPEMKVDAQERSPPQEVLGDVIGRGDRGADRALAACLGQDRVDDHRHRRLEVRVGPAAACAELEVEIEDKD